MAGSAWGMFVNLSAHGPLNRFGEKRQDGTICSRGGVKRHRACTPVACGGVGGVGGIGGCLF